MNRNLRFGGPAPAAELQQRGLLGCLWSGRSALLIAPVELHEGRVRVHLPQLQHRVRQTPRASVRGEEGLDEGGCLALVDLRPAEAPPAMHATGTVDTAADGDARVHARHHSFARVGDSDCSRVAKRASMIGGRRPAGHTLLRHIGLHTPRTEHRCPVLVFLAVRPNVAFLHNHPDVTGFDLLGRSVFRRALRVPFDGVDVGVAAGATHDHALEVSGLAHDPLVVLELQVRGVHLHPCGKGAGVLCNAVLHLQGAAARNVAVLW
mmetsp:Transcript_56236/g.167264  ORF Transcript_56236/g.167264 Transcript_56236/m.167264 type:complete len:264 (-) Transcript_56236:483-1274(-)